MSKAVSSIASEVNELLRKNGNEFMTLKWAQFYKICDRERLADVVMENIAKQLKKMTCISSTATTSLSFVTFAGAL